MISFSIDFIACFTLENISSIGAKPGEYGGKNVLGPPHLGLTSQLLVHGGYTTVIHDHNRVWVCTIVRHELRKQMGVNEAVKGITITSSF